MFYLKAPNDKNGLSLIYVQYYYQGRRLTMSSGLSIHPDHWDKAKELPKRSFRYYSQFKAVLDNLERTIRDVHADMRMTGIPSTELLKQEVLKRLAPAKPLTVHDYALQYTERAAPRTVKNYRSVANQIKAFNPSLTFDQIDIDLMDDFRTFLLDSGLEQSTAGQYYQAFKTILADAAERGIEVSQKFKTKKVRISKTASTEIFLDEAELKKIADADLPKFLHKHRDFLLVAAFTGVRYSDIDKINRSAFTTRNGTPYFVVTDKKTGNTAYIPAHPIVIEVMERNDWELPELSYVKLNTYLRRVGMLAKIDTLITVTRYPGGKRVDTVMPKYKMIKSHTGRRSMICNLLIAGVPQAVIKSISGHKSDQAFNRYIRLTPQDFLSVAYRSEFYSKARVI